MAVAIGASIAAAALLLYSVELQRTNTAKALQLIAQIEGLKMNLRKQIDFGECSTPSSDAALASQVLQNIKMEGVPLSGVPQTDANTLGFSSLTVGTLDTENLDGSVALPGTPASVTLRNGSMLGGASH